MIHQCATFVGTVTYMSPERIRNESYSYPADIWSLGIALFECGTGEFPYAANEGPVNLMLQVRERLFLLLYISLNYCYYFFYTDFHCSAYGVFFFSEEKHLVSIFYF